jgi:hypothetical protein
VISLNLTSDGAQDTSWQAIATTPAPENLKLPSFSPGRSCLKSKELSMAKAVVIEESYLASFCGFACALGFGGVASNLRSTSSVLGCCGSFGGVFMMDSLNRD